MVIVEPMGLRPEVAVAAVVAALVLVVQHYFPWRMALGRELRKVEAYVMGTLTLVLPLLVVLAIWQAWMALAAALAIFGAGGAAVLGTYALDAALDARRRAIEAEAREKALREAGDR